MFLDHLVWAVPNLEKAIDDFNEKTGVKAVIGGSHPDHGTHNALISMGEGQYFEILARDYSLPAGELANFCKNLTQPSLVTWVVRTNNMLEVVQKAKAAGYKANLKNMSRLKPTGEKLEWQLLSLIGHNQGNYVPLIIDWQKCRHPSLDTPTGLDLISFTIEISDPTPLQEIFSALSIPVELKQSVQNRLVACFNSPKGQFTLTT